MKSLLSAQQFTRENLKELCDTALKIEELLKKKKRIPLLEDYVMASLFFEPSTRTRFSFESAMHRLGGRVITSVGVQFSSLSKGETLLDTIRVTKSYADIIVIRHSMEGASSHAAKNVDIPIINGGDGAGEHPTQALLDFYTILKHKKIEERKITIAFVGDIRNGRTIHSLITLMSLYDVHFIFISPDELALPQKYKEFLKDKNISFSETENIESIHNVDVAYVTRIQQERFQDMQEYEKFKNVYTLNKALIKKCNPELIVMHPLPRLNEISTDVDSLPQAVYFEQATNGLYTRMALLLYLLKVNLV